MARGSIIKAVITGDASNLERELGRAEGSLRTFASKMTRAFAVTGLAVGGAVALGRPLVDAASSWEEAASKAGEVFGEAAGSIDAFAASASAIGLSETDALNAASAFGIFANSAGLSADEVATFSEELTRAGADAASFFDLDPDDALGALESGLAGQVEPLRRLGVFLNAATLDAKAAELGFGDLFSELDAGEQAVVRQAEILDQLGENGALGDVERTSGSLANTQRRLSARFENLQMKIGRALVPVALALADAFLALIDFTATLGDKFRAIGDWMSRNTPIVAGLGVVIAATLAPAVYGLVTATLAWTASSAALVTTLIAQAAATALAFAPVILAVAAVAALAAGLVWAYQNVDWFRDAVDRMGDIAQAVWGWLRDNVPPVMERIIGFLQGVWHVIRDDVIPFFRRLWEKGVEMKDNLLVAFAFIRMKFGEVKDWFAERIGDIVGFFRGLPRRVGRALSTLGEEIWEGVRDAWNYVRDKVNTLADITLPGGISLGGLTNLATDPFGAALDLAGGAFNSAPPAIAQPAGASVAGSAKGNTVVIELDGQVLAEAVVDSDRNSGGVLLP